VFTSGDDILVGDLTPGTIAEGGDGIGCPSGLAGDAATLAAIAADPNCFSFNEMLPGGFTPQFGGYLNDFSAAAGLRGEFENGLTYDISVNGGRNEVDFFMTNTVNASLGPDTPMEHRPGTYIQTEKNVNADFVYPVEAGMASDLNVAFGLEWREEQFEALSGGISSWVDGPLASQGFSVGSNGFPGFGPVVAGVSDRSNTAVYLDLETDVTEALTLGAALRYEDFSDFGGTTNYKVSGLYRVTENISLRSTYSTGFRAPTPGQSNVTNVSTTANTSGDLINEGTIPSTNPVAVAFGGLPLEPEKSKNFTLGAAFSLGEGNLTIDFFHIKVKDRITRTSSIILTDEDKAALVAAGITGAADLSEFRFFTNDFSSKTRGLDVVMTYPLNFTDSGSTELSGTFNYTKTSVTSFDPTDPDELLDSCRVKQLEENLPNWRGNVTLSHQESKWRAQARANYYGSYFEAHLDACDLPIDAGSEITLDVEVGYRVMDNLQVIVGADNVFNNFPEANPFATGWGAKYSVTSPMGFNGGFYYVRLRFEM
jgi:iron complex outermembrane receptor protein